MNQICLLDLGFTQKINAIFKLVDKPSLQKIACSATTHESLANQFANYFKDTKVISLNKSIWMNQQINHNIVYTSDNNDPYDTLKKLLKTINPFFCIIFANTKDESKKIYDFMLQNGYYNTALLHKDLLPRQRKKIFNEINENKYQYLVATDLASRGIDIVGADIVISFGLPEESIWYMHRVGRVGRYKSAGTSYVIFRGKDSQIINRLTNKNINFNYYLLKNNEMINKPIKLRLPKKKFFDLDTNQKIKKIINTQSKKVKPGYKKKIKNQIHRIKQKIKHEYIEKRIKQTLLQKNIKRTKNKHRK